jgi:hypothetical protein
MRASRATMVTASYYWRLGCAFWPLMRSRRAGAGVCPSGKAYRRAFPSPGRGAAWRSKRAGELMELSRRFHQLTLLAGIITVLLLDCRLASAESANYRMPGCRSFANQDNDSRYLFSAGVCSGIVEALLSLAPALGVCRPPEATIGQGIRVVVQYVDSQPARSTRSL